MSLMRAFTTKLRKGDGDSPFDPVLGRAASQRAGKPIQRSQISGPVALVSTTNMLSYHAPNIAGTARIQTRNPSTSSADMSAEDSDSSMLSLDTSGSADTHTDASSVENSPIIPHEPEENHLSCYFKPALNTASPDTSPTFQQSPYFNSPSIPHRVPSHSKKAHEIVHRKKSFRISMSPRIGTTATSRGPADVFAPFASSGAAIDSDETPRQHDIGSELAQLEEMQEELAAELRAELGKVGRDAQWDDDATAMKLNDLAVFTLVDYLELGLESMWQEAYLDAKAQWI